MKHDPDDMILWADGTWCYRHQLSDMAFMSDDYEEILFNSEAWWELLEDVKEESHE